MSDNSTEGRAAADQVVAGSSGPGLTDAEVAERVEALPAEMTVAEKGGN